MHKRLSREAALLKVHSEAQKTLKKKLDEEKAKYEIVAS